MDRHECPLASSRAFALEPVAVQLTNHPVFSFDGFMPLYNWTYPLCGDQVVHAAELGRTRVFEPFASARGRALYVHVPFCETICSFCPFSRGLFQASEEVEAYVGALLREIAAKGRHAILRSAPIRAVFYGGGTPSLLSAAQVGRIQAALADHFDLSQVKEVSFEFEVKSVGDADYVATLREHGISHGRFGLQTLSPRYRALFELTATPEQVQQAAEVLRAGLDHVSCDLLFGMHGQELDELEADLVGAVDLGLDNVDVYPINNLMVQPRLLRAFREAGLRPTSGLTKHYMRLFVRERLASLGFAPHNGHGYVRSPPPADGQVTTDRYRFVYHEHVLGPVELDLLGFGSNAISSSAGITLQNLGNRRIYIQGLVDERLPMMVKVHGPKIDAARTLALWLPYFGSVPKAQVAWSELPEEVSARLDAAVDKQLVLDDGELLRLSDRGWAWYTELMAWLLPDRELRAVRRLIHEALGPRITDVEDSGLEGFPWQRGAWVKPR